MISAAPLYPTTHWNVGILSSDRVLNTVTGNLNDVTVQPIGWDVIETAYGKLRVQKYQYTGGLYVSVWYDPDGRWVKMEFAGKDGALIEYRHVNNVE